MSGWRFFVAVVFWVHANQYFGWNWSPKSAEEVLADGIVMLLLALSISPHPKDSSK